LWGNRWSSSRVFYLTIIYHYHILALVVICKIQGDLSKELCASIGLYTLDWERHLLYDLMQEIDGIFRVAPRIYPKNPISCTIIDSSILVNPRSYLTCIHLDTITWYRTIISVLSFALLPPDRTKSLSKPCPGSTASLRRWRLIFSMTCIPCPAA
jgi:hypothetical protein